MPQAVTLFRNSSSMDFHWTTLVLFSLATFSCYFATSPSQANKILNQTRKTQGSTYSTSQVQPQYRFCCVALDSHLAKRPLADSIC